MAKKNPKKENIELVYNSVEDYILENHKLCSLKDVVNCTNLSESKCRKILNHLRINNKIEVVYEGRGKTNIYIPKYMFNEILRLQQKPDWLQKYSFKRKDEKLKEIESLREKVNKYEIIERLLYGTGKALEESVAFSLTMVGFKDVKIYNNEGDRDVSFFNNEMNYLMEIQGTTKQGNKRKINQLRGWIETAVESGFKVDEVRGIFVVNHYRKINPNNRESPLTDHAKKFLKLYGYIFFTTEYLYNIVKDFLNDKITDKQAIDKILKGESFE